MKYDGLSQKIKFCDKSVLKFSIKLFMMEKQQAHFSLLNLLEYRGMKICIILLIAYLF